MVIPSPWEPETFFGFLAFCARQTSWAEVLALNPIWPLHGATPVGLFSLFSSVAAVIAVAIFRRPSGWSSGAAAAALTLAVAELYLCYVRAKNVVAASKTLPKEEEMAYGCTLLLWIPTIALLSFLFVFAVTAAFVALRLARRRGASGDPSDES